MLRVVQDERSNEALKRRGSLTIWFDPAMTWAAAPTGRRGRPQNYSNTAIQTCLTMKVLFGMALRQTTGFVASPLRLLIDNPWTCHAVMPRKDHSKSQSCNILRCPQRDYDATSLAHFCTAVLT